MLAGEEDVILWLCARVCMGMSSVDNELASTGLLLMLLLVTL
jgi:hypothetical protein